MGNTCPGNTWQTTVENDSVKSWDGSCRICSRKGSVEEYISKAFACFALFQTHFPLQQLGDFSSASLVILSSRKGNLLMSGSCRRKSDPMCHSPKKENNGRRGHYQGIMFAFQFDTFRLSDTLSRPVSFLLSCQPQLLYIYKSVCINRNWSWMLLDDWHLELDCGPPSCFFPLALTNDIVKDTGCYSRYAVTNL